MKYCKKSKRVVPDNVSVCPHHGTAECLGQFGTAGSTPTSRRTGSTSGDAGEAVLQLELRSLEGRIHAGTRQSRFLAVGTVCALLIGLLSWLGHYASTVLSYAKLDASLSITRDPADPARIAVHYQPLSEGRVGFRRSDADRQTELLDRAVSTANSGPQRLEWRLNRAREGDAINITYRKGWSLTTQELRVPAPPPLPPLGSAVLTGKVVDATTSTPLAGAEIQIAGTRLKETSDTNGEFRLVNAPEGPVGIKVSAPKFSTNELEKELTPGAETRLDVALSPGMARGQMRIVLTWGQNPADLDAHLDAPLPGGKRCHIFFGDRGDLHSKEYVNLDVDCQKGMGPETITVLGVQPGRYHYFVHDFTNIKNLSSRALAQSKAKVEVYQGGQMLRRFTVDDRSEGNIWHVCDIEVGADAKATVHKIDRYESKVLEMPVRATCVMLIDSSEQMSGRRLEVLKQGASNLLNSFPLDRGLKVGIITARSGTSTLHHAVSTNRQSLQDAIASLDSEGEEALVKGLEKVFEMFQEVRENRVLFVFTTGSPSNEEEVLSWSKRLKSSGVEIVAFGIGSGNIAFLRKLASTPEKAGVVPIK